MKLNEQRIVILGGSSGIGLAAAQAAARKGANVVIASSSKDRVQAALATLPAGAEGHIANLADESAIRTLFETIGEFDHLIYTAVENLQLGSLASADIDAAHRFFGVRYWGAVCAAKYGSRKIRAGLPGSLCPPAPTSGCLATTTSLAGGATALASPRVRCIATPLLARRARPPSPSQAIILAPPASGLATCRRVFA